MAAGKKKDRCGNRTRIVKVRLTEDEFALMRSTEGLRDEFAVVLDVIKRYISPEPSTQP